MPCHLQYTYNILGNKSNQLIFGYINDKMSCKQFPYYFANDFINVATLHFKTVNIIIFVLNSFSYIFK